VRRGHFSVCSSLDGGDEVFFGVDYMDPKVRELIVISLFAAVCAGFAVVQGQRFMAFVLAVECSFGMIEAIRRSR
jgi:hypothetical protein